METVTANATALATSSTITGNVIWLYALIVALLVLVPHLVDIFKAYKSKNTNIELLIEKAAPIDKNELKVLLREVGKSPPGITGLTRGAIALTVIVILGIALFHLIITRTAADNQVIGNILSMAGSLIAAIVGFYFGGRSKEKAAEESAEEAAGKTERITKETAEKAAQKIANEMTGKVEKITKETAEKATKKATEELTKKIKNKP